MFSKIPRKMHNLSGDAIDSHGDAAKNERQRKKTKSCVGYREKVVYGDFLGEIV